MDCRLSQLVRVYDDFLDGSLCDQIVKAFESEAAAATPRQVAGQLSFDELNIDGLTEWLPISAGLEAAKDAAFERYKAECQGVFPETYDHESFRIKRYKPATEDQFRNHVDGYDRASAQRFLVCFWYLNTVTDGGETEFPRLRVRVAARRGRLIMFPPFWMYEHAGLAPRSCNKYIISTYLRFP